MDSRNKKPASQSFFDLLDTNAGKFAKLIGSIIVILSAIAFTYNKAQDAERFFKSSEQFRQETREKLGEIRSSQKFTEVTYQFILEQDSVMWFTCDSNGFTKSVGDATTRRLVLSQSQLMETNWINRIPPSEHPEIYAKYQSAIKYKHDFDIVYTFKLGNNKNVRIHAHCKKAGSDWFGILEFIDKDN